MNIKNLIDQAASAIVKSNLTLALTGAGVSVDSGIPDFRGAGGLWSRYDPSEYATIEAFRNNPEKIWHMLRELEELVLGAEPNATHFGLGELERIGCLDCVITQNIDNLHQAGGSRDVIEYHGNGSTLSCIWCGSTRSARETRGVYPPICLCGKILKPDIVMFGEMISGEALNRSFHLASRAGALLVIGTSATVSPANTIPSIAKQNGAFIIEINTERTHLTEYMSDVFIQGRAGEIVESLVEEVKVKLGGVN